MGIVDLMIIPIIQLVVIGFFVSFVGYFVIKAFHNAYTKSFKFFIRHKIMRKSYPENIVSWCMSCMEQGIGWYDAKKLLMTKNYPQKQINETLWIYDRIIIETQGGIKKNGKQFKGISGKVEIKAKSDLPTI